MGATVITDEMVERAAQAAWENDGPCSWATLGDCTRADLRSDARAALEAAIAKMDVALIAAGRDAARGATIALTEALKKAHEERDALRAELMGAPVCCDTPANLLQEIARASGRDPVDRAVDDITDAYAILRAAGHGGSVDEEVAAMLSRLRAAEEQRDEAIKERDKLTLDLLLVEDDRSLQIEATKRAEHDAQLQHVVDDIIDWQAKTFPGATLRGAITHLLKEVDEVRELPTFFVEPSEPVALDEELTDLVFLIIQAKTCLGTDLLDGLRAKLEKNKQRKWKAPDANGVVEHVRGVND